LLVYDLQGKQLQLLESGRLNNVDVRQNIHFESTDERQRFDLALATQRDDNSLALYTIANDGEVREAARLPTTLEKYMGFVRTVRKAEDWKHSSMTKMDVISNTGSDT
jgi:3-phytase